MMAIRLGRFIPHTADILCFFLHSRETWGRFSHQLTDTRKWLTLGPPKVWIQMTQAAFDESKFTVLLFSTTALVTFAEWNLPHLLIRCANTFFKTINTLTSLSSCFPGRFLMHPSLTICTAEIARQHLSCNTDCLNLCYCHAYAGMCT